jgi:hypothetical protein
MRDAMLEHAKTLATSPSGLLIYHPAGAGGMTGRQLGTEFANEIVEVLLAFLLLSLTRLTSYASRVGFIVVVGVIAAMPTNVSYWVWYGFPGSYTAAYTAVQIIGFTVAGLVGAAVLARTSSRASGASA